MKTPEKIFRAGTCSGRTSAGGIFFKIFFEHPVVSGRILLTVNNYPTPASVWCSVSGLSSPAGILPRNPAFSPAPAPVRTGYRIAPPNTATYCLWFSGVKMGISERIITPFSGIIASSHRGEREKRYNGALYGPGFRPQFPGTELLPAGRSAVILRRRYRPGPH